MKIVKEESIKAERKVMKKEAGVINGDESEEAAKRKA